MGINEYVVSDQPHVVDKAIEEFVESLIEVVQLFLAVSFVSLGFRDWVLLPLPFHWYYLVTFINIMMMLKIDLQRISLGTNYFSGTLG